MGTLMKLMEEKTKKKEKKLILPDDLVLRPDNPLPECRDTFDPIVISISPLSQFWLIIFLFFSFFSSNFVSFVFSCDLLKAFNLFLSESLTFRATTIAVALPLISLLVFGISGLHLSTLRCASE